MAGLLQFLALRSYPLQLVYKPAHLPGVGGGGGGGGGEGGAERITADQPCLHRCPTCHLAGLDQATTGSHSLDSKVPGEDTQTQHADCSQLDLLCGVSDARADDDRASVR